VSSGAGGQRARGGSLTPLIAGNWKMHKTPSEAHALIEELLPLLDSGGGVEVAVCPPFLALEAAVRATRGSRVEVYAQNMHDQPEGAFTGEVSGPMLHDVGVTGTLLGHSERREYFGESDHALQRKVPAALAAGLRPILCVGETEEERERAETQRKLRHQVQEDLARVDVEQLSQVVISYEPIWAIGTGRVATPEQAQEAIAFVRALVAGRSPEQAERTRVLYGGSVKPENAWELLALPDVDGVLVGGASLDARAFAAIVDAARA
jgi:triosephosphate isomerase